MPNGSHKITLPHLNMESRNKNGENIRQKKKNQIRITFYSVEAITRVPLVISW